MKILHRLFMWRYLITCLVLSWQAGHCALPATSVWEVRPTVGTDTNGGGFVTGSSGTDMSQFNNKNAAACSNCQSSTVNISTTDAVAAGTTTITSATANFSAAIVGNVINMSGGTGALASAWFQVATFVNVTTITVDRTVAVGTGITMNIGGALATISQAFTNAVASNTIFVKASGTYTVTTALAVGGFQNAPNPFTFTGYTATRTDGGRVTWTTATNSINLMNFNGGTGSNWLFQNFNFTNTAGTPFDAFHALSGNNTKAVVCRNCTFSGFRDAVNGNFAVDFTFIDFVLDSCEIKSSTSHGVFNSAGLSIFGCYIHDNTGDGVHVDSAASIAEPLEIRNSIIKSNTIGVNNQAGVATSITTLPTSITNSAIINNSSDGIRLEDDHTASVPGLLMWNNIIDSNAGSGVNYQGGGLSWSWAVFRSNAYRANTGGDITGGPPKDASDFTLTADPFVNRGANNFALNSTAGGGAACKAAGFPGVLIVGGTGFADTGPLQSQAASGGGTKGFVSQ